MHSTIEKIGIIALFAAAAVGCKRQTQPAATPQMPPPAVIVASAQSKDVPEYIDGIGKATALESVTITPRIAGQIVERHFEDGSDLTKGQILFVIDKAPSEAALASAQANVAQAKAAADFAKIELDRYSAVAGTRAISKSDYDTKSNAVDVANAQVAAAAAAVKTAQINLDFCTIKCPIDGRASSRMVDVGNVVKENETALLSVQKIDPIYADFTVNESQLTDVRKNMADGTLKALVFLGNEKTGREGALTFLDNAVQDATGTIKLRATVDNNDHHFWPGQFVNVRLVLRTLKDAVLVPKTATQVSQQGLFVFRVDDNDKSPTKMVVTQQPVTLGQDQGGEMVVISDGLKSGDRVVTSGQMLLQAGMPVMVVPAGPPGNAPPGGVSPGGGAPDATSSPAATQPATSPSASQDQSSDRRQS